MKIRAKIAKGESVRFISHLDFAGALEKAVRRAGLPLALSRGYRPRLQISYASALALGATSEAEYADFELQRQIPVTEFKCQLNKQLPAGVRILTAIQVADNAPSLMSQVSAASYRVTAEMEGQVEPQLENLWEQFLKQDKIIIIKTTKRRSRPVDIIPLIFKVRFYPGPKESKWDLLVSTGSAGNLRPEELLAAFFAFAKIPGAITRIHRTGLFIERYGGLMTPLARPRAAEGLEEGS